MDTIPEIGARVKWTGKPLDQCDWRIGVTGEVVAHYLGGERCYDEEECEYYTVPHHVGVKVDSVPKNWPYPSDRFAPDIDELELI